MILSMSVPTSLTVPASTASGRSVGVAHDQHRFAQRGRFFLHAAGVGDDEGGARHQIDEGQVVLRLDEMDVVRVAQDAAHRLLHRGVEVHRIHHLDVGSLAQRFERGTDALEAVAEVFAAVASHQDEALGGIEKLELRAKTCGERVVRLQLGDDLLQGIDDGVAGDADGTVGDGFVEQALACTLGGRKVQRRDATDDAAIHLFGPGGVDVAGAQACLDMADGHLLIKRREAGRHGGGGVAVHQQQVVAGALEDVAQAQEDVAGDVGEVLPRLHDVEVMVGADVEQVQHLVEHLTVLGGDAHLCLDGRVGGQGVDDRCHLDGLGAGAENGKDSHGGWA